jgi:hypothetical protein
MSRLTEVPLARQCDTSNSQNSIISFLHLFSHLHFYNSQHNRVSVPSTSPSSYTFDDREKEKDLPDHSVVISMSLWNPSFQWHLIPPLSIMLPSRFLRFLVPTTLHRQRWPFDSRLKKRKKSKVEIWNLKREVVVIKVDSSTLFNDRISIFTHSWSRRLRIYNLELTIVTPSKVDSPSLDSKLETTFQNFFSILSFLIVRSFSYILLVTLPYLRALPSLLLKLERIIKFDQVSKWHLQHQRKQSKISIS